MRAHEILRAHGIYPTAVEHGPTCRAKLCTHRRTTRCTARGKHDSSIDQSAAAVQPRDVFFTQGVVLAREHGDLLSRDEGPPERVDTVVQDLKMHEFVGLRTNGEPDVLDEDVGRDVVDG